MIRFACPSCRAALTVPENRAGQKTLCPHCGHKLLIPANRNKTLPGEPLPAGPARPPLPPTELEHPRTALPAAKPAKSSVTARCPGCGRQIPLNGPGELAILIECARCETRFVPQEANAGGPARPAAGGAVPAPADAPSPGLPPATKSLLIGLVAAAIVGCLFLLVGGVLVLGSRPNAQPTAPARYAAALPDQAKAQPPSIPATAAPRPESSGHTAEPSAPEPAIVPQTAATPAQAQAPSPPPSAIDADPVTKGMRVPMEWPQGTYVRTFYAMTGEEEAALRSRFPVCEWALSQWRKPLTLSGP
jgi:DNA-directed RNA polymerase subunit RPC12/RpoP